MADDQGPKIASIDELVNELTKKNPPPPPAPPKPPMSSQFQPNPNPSPTPAPKPSVPAPEIPKPKFTPPPLPSIMPRPAPAPSVVGPFQPAPPKPSAAPAQQPSSAPPVKEYQSSIRTMKEDISTLKQGQKPAGVDVPRIIQPPAPTSAPAAPKPPPPAGGPGQPQQFKMPSVNLGEAQKTGPLPQAKEPTPPPVRGPILPPTGKPTPVPPMPTGRQEKSQIYAPPLSTGGISGNRNLLFGIIAGAVVLFGALYWFLVLRVPEPEIVLETLTPPPAGGPVATPVVTLGDLFNAPEVIMSVDAVNPAETFSASIGGITVDGGMFRKIIIKATPDSVVSWTGLTDIPQQVLDSLGGEAVVLAYGQKEIFNQNGQLNTTAPVGTRAIIVAEVRDASSALQGVTAWESTIVEAFRKLFVLNPAQQPNPDFMDNTYQGAAIRFRNFPYADRSIDIGVVLATNGKSYLVIAGSRESMFTTVDVLRGIATLP